jgi:hypothetical protein
MLVPAIANEQMLTLFNFTVMYLYITRGHDLARRSEEVLAMRRAVHEKYRGVVRANATIYSFLWRQIDDAALKYELTLGNRLPDMPDPEPYVAPKPPKKRAPRKRAVVAPDSMDVDDDDEDDTALGDNGEGAISLAAAMNGVAVSTPGQSSSLKRARRDVSDDGGHLVSPSKRNTKEGVLATPSPAIRKKERKRIKVETLKSSRDSSATEGR